MHMRARACVVPPVICAYGKRAHHPPRAPGQPPVNAQRARGFGVAGNCVSESVRVLFRIIIHVITDAIERSYWPIRKIEILMPIIMCVYVRRRVVESQRPRPLRVHGNAPHLTYAHSHIHTSRACADGKHAYTARAKFSSRQGCNLVPASVQTYACTRWRRQSVALCCAVQTATATASSSAAAPAPSI